MSRVNILLFGLPAVVLLLLPLLCLVAWYSFSDRFDFTMFLLAVVIFWVTVPAMIFGEPFFEHGPSPADIGYYPNGFLGWLLLIVFYAMASLAISLLIMYARKRRHLTNR